MVLAIGLVACGAEKQPDETPVAPLYPDITAAPLDAVSLTSVRGVALADYLKNGIRLDLRASVASEYKPIYCGLGLCADPPSQPDHTDFNYMKLDRHTPGSSPLDERVDDLWAIALPQNEVGGYLPDELARIQVAQLDDTTSSAAILSTFSFPDDAKVQAIQATGSDATARLAAVRQLPTEEVTAVLPGGMRSRVFPLYPTLRQFEVSVFDLERPGSLLPASRIVIDGEFVQMIGFDQHLVIISRVGAWLDGLAIDADAPARYAANEEILGAATLAELLPRGVDATGTRPLINSCAIPSSFAARSGEREMVLISRIDPVAGEIVESQCIAAAGVRTFAGEGGVYLHGSTANSNATAFHRFDIGDAGIFQEAAGSVPGQLAHNTRAGPVADERDGLLRLMTRLPNAAEPQGGRLRLAVLSREGDALVEMAALAAEPEGDGLLSQAQDFYGAYFSDNSVYLVNVSAAEPLVRVDLSDPYEPVLSSELQLPGAIRALESLGPSHLLGISVDRDAYDNERYSAWIISETGGGTVVSTQTIQLPGAAQLSSGQLLVSEVAGTAGAYRVTLPIYLPRSESPLAIDSAHALQLLTVNAEAGEIQSSGLLRSRLTSRRQTALLSEQSLFWAVGPHLYVSTWAMPFAQPAQDLRPPADCPPAEPTPSFQLTLSLFQATFESCPPLTVRHGDDWQSEQLLVDGVMSGRQCVYYGPDDLYGIFIATLSYPGFISKNVGLTVNKLDCGIEPATVETFLRPQAE